jgi:ribosomal protein L19
MLYFGLLFSEGVFLRCKRKMVLGFLKVNVFLVGDYLAVVFFSKNCPFPFEGMCMAIRKKSLLLPNTSFVIRNSLVGVLIQVVICYYYNRVYNMVFLHYKKDVGLNIRSSKIFRLFR